MSNNVRVVVADDSPFICRLLTSYLQSSPGFEVVGSALNGARAVELVKQSNPAVVTLDLDMPVMSGLEALEHIMVECPTPVIMVSGVSRDAANTTIHALKQGAVDFLLKYTPGVDTDPESFHREILDKVRAASQVKVIRSLRRSYHEPNLAEASSDRSADQGPAWTEPTFPRSATQRQEASPTASVVIVGASTGGPMAVRSLLEQLPLNYPETVIVVQHMPATFTEVLSVQLDRQLDLRVQEARDGDRLEPGLVLIAPGDKHLLLGSDLRVELNTGAKIRGHRPAIDVTMQSVVQVLGSRVTGVLLTGMGDDGVAGMSFIRAKGGETFAQDAESCVVNGMPQRAIDAGAVDHVGSPTRIGQLLRSARSARPFENSRGANSQSTSGTDDSLLAQSGQAKEQLSHH